MPNQRDEEVSGSVFAALKILVIVIGLTLTGAGVTAIGFIIYELIARII